MAAALQLRGRSITFHFAVAQSTVSQCAPCDDAGQARRRCSAFGMRAPLPQIAGISNGIIIG
jgi:hypothetical protein